MFADAPGTRAYAAPRRENDAGGRFTNRPSGDSRRAFRPSACAVVSCGLAARPPVAGRAAPAVAGATPLAEGSVRHSAECVFTPSPLADQGSLPHHRSLREGRLANQSRRAGSTSPIPANRCHPSLAAAPPAPPWSRARGGRDRQAPAGSPGRDPRLAIRGASRLGFASAPERVQRSRGATASRSPSASAASPMTPPARFTGMAATFVLSVPDSLSLGGHRVHPLEPAYQGGTIGPRDPGIIPPSPMPERGHRNPWVNQTRPGSV